MKSANLLALTIVLPSAAWAGDHEIPVWFESDQVFSPDPAEFDRFGLSVAVDGSTMMVGEPGDGCDPESSYAGTGKVHVFEWQGTAWIQVQQLTSSSLTCVDMLGYTIDINGDFAFVSTHWIFTEEPNTKVVVFKKVDGIWVEHQTIANANPMPWERFGYRIDISGEWAAILNSCSDWGVYQCYYGTIAMYRLDDGYWELTHWIENPHGPTSPIDFGLSMALEGGTLFVGSTHGVYRYENQGATWELVDSWDGSVSGEGWFGVGLDLDGELLVVSAPDEDTVAENHGAVYVYRGSDGTWGLEQQIIPPAHTFSWVSVDQNVLTVAAHEPGGPVVFYVYAFDGMDWTLAGQLAPSSDDAELAYTYDMSDEYVVVGTADTSENANVLVYDVACHLNCASVSRDPCLWWDCSTCSSTPVHFADMGGAFGECAPDGAADGNDRFRALNCFADTQVDGVPGYPCEQAPPTAVNVDAGGPFGSCEPDGVCDGNDAFHALNAFSGATTCSCPLDGSPMPVIDAVVTRQATLELRPTKKHVRPGDMIAVEVFLSSPLDDLRGYQLHLGVAGGNRGQLELIDISIDRRRDAVFADKTAWTAFNVNTGQMLAGLDTPGVRTTADSYLATLTYRASRDALGPFSIELLHDVADASQRTFLFMMDQRAVTEIGVEPVVVDVVAGPKRRDVR